MAPPGERGGGGGGEAEARLSGGICGEIVVDLGVSPPPAVLGFGSRRSEAGGEEDVRARVVCAGRGEQEGFGM
jgi:hypothetical protein